MIRLILAHKFMEGIEEKLLKSQDKKLGKKYSKNHEKTLHHNIRDDLTQKHGYIDANQEFTRCKNCHNILPLFRGLEGSLTFSPRLSYTMKHTHTFQKETISWGGRGIAECLPLHQPLGSYL
jgi:hypothetical protein